MIDSLMDMARYMGMTVMRDEQGLLPDGCKWSFGPAGTLIVSQGLWDQLMVDFKEVELLTEVLEDRYAARSA